MARIPHSTEINKNEIYLDSSFSHGDKVSEFGSTSTISGTQFTSQTNLYPAQPKPSPKSKKSRRYIGLILALAASLLFSVVLLLVKLLEKYEFDAYGVSFWRYIGITVPSLPLLFYFEYGPPAKDRGGSVLKQVWPPSQDDKWKAWIWLFARGVIGCGAVIFRYYSLKYMTIGDTSVITYATPVVVTILAHFFLQERCSVFSVVIVILTFCGVVVVTKPPIFTGAAGFDTDTMIGTGFACASLMCTSIQTIITRKVREVHFTLVTFVIGFVGIVQTILLIYFLGHFNLPSGLVDSLYLSGVAVFCFLAQISMVIALKFENAGPVALVRSCDVLFGFLLQYWFLSISPNGYSILGAGLVLFGVLSIAFRKWLGTLPEEDSRRKAWGWVLK